MDLLTNVAIAFGLAMDAFAVSLGVGTGGYLKDPRSNLRLAFHFGIFQMLMTILGWLLGSTIVGFIENYDHWVALALLVYVGVNMIRSGARPGMESYRTNPSKGMTLVFLAVATSLDALAVGLSLAMIEVPVIWTSVIIGLVAFGMSVIGLLAGNGLGTRFGKRMEILGGIILITIGLRIVITHL